jgi:hypothetical protein
MQTAVNRQTQDHHVFLQVARYMHKASKISVPFCYHVLMRLRTLGHARVHHIAMACLALVMLSGCYKRVVSANGLGASQYVVRESDRSNTAADRWFDSAVMGEQPSEKRYGTVPAVSPSSGRWRSNVPR